MEGWTPRAIVVGSGLAGLSSARELAAAGWDVTVVSPGRAGADCASHRVHALVPWILFTAPCVRGDSPDRFCRDLKIRGEGIERDGLTEVLAAEAHGAAEELRELLELERLDGAPVLLPGDELPRGVRCLPRQKGPLLRPLMKLCSRGGVKIADRTLVVGLLFAADRVAGIIVFDRATQRLERWAADVVVLACGGVGAVFPLTTGPRWCRGSALALSSVAGVMLHHAEATQALPITATPPLYFPTTAALLAGRILVDGVPLQPASDLQSATRQVAEALERGATVVLDPVGEAASLLPPKVRDSNVFRRERKVPLAVAVHHGIGGVAIDACGRTSLPGLYACGEAAGGVQGARRTMGTGLLEARVFGLRAGRAAVRDAVRLGPAPGATEEHIVGTPAAAQELEARMDHSLGPLTVLRPSRDVARVIEVLEAWPMSQGEPREAGYIVGLRRAAAVSMMRAQLEVFARESESEIARQARVNGRL